MFVADTTTASKGHAQLTLTEGLYRNWRQNQQNGFRYPTPTARCENSGLQVPEGRLTITVLWTKVSVEHHCSTVQYFRHESIAVNRRGAAHNNVG